MEYRHEHTTAGEAEISLPRCVTIRFRPNDQPCSALSRLDLLKRGEVVVVQTDHGMEPAVVVDDFHPSSPSMGKQSSTPESGGPVAPDPAPTIIRRANREEQEKHLNLIAREKEDFVVGQRLIDKHGLPMKLIKVERFFNGSKIVFCFTAENRVDFRELVKDLVQEFRTRVEIRQIGVRHETKMIGGLGCCGRELCCSSFIRNFAPVSIKMAKEQGLPLNPAKISGICNRLLCCLTFEFETYREIRRRMPKVGKIVTLDGRSFKIVKIHILEERVEVLDLEEPDRLITWQASEWRRCEQSRASGKPPGPGGDRGPGHAAPGQPPSPTKERVDFTPGEKEGLSPHGDRREPKANKGDGAQNEEGVQQGKKPKSGGRRRPRQNPPRKARQSKTAHQSR